MTSNRLAEEEVVLDAALQWDRRHVSRLDWSALRSVDARKVLCNTPTSRVGRGNTLPPRWTACITVTVFKTRQWKTGLVESRKGTLQR